ncbi:MAG: A/G-specific adenine glycosylase [Methanolinea sp.]|nr:A/G-specific adenine glycosylase [Methanolinea sp.]
MLQQTRVGSVVGRYERFLSRFPDFEHLADADLSEVLTEWQGLGYNRRAAALHAIARKVMNDFSGRLPDDERVLATLPGIGTATAASIAAFAFNRPSVLIETNIRRVFLHCFFPMRDAVPDREILPIVAATCDHGNPREWYYALMDLGSEWKTRFPNPNRRSAHYRRQSPFEGSIRQARGAIVKILIAEGGIACEELGDRLAIDRDRFEAALEQMKKEGLIKEEKGRIRLG